MTKRDSNQGQPADREEMRIRRTSLLLVFALVALLSCLIRVIYIKAAHGKEYQAAAEAQQLNSTDVVIPALRGSIYDRDGNALAESVRVYNVILDPQTLIDSKQSVQDSTVQELMAVLSITDENVIRKYFSQSYYSYRYLKLEEGKGISADKMQEIQDGIDQGAVVGVWFEEDESRTYPNDSIAAHVIGFNGVYGVEQYYNDYLSGTDGRKMVVAGAGNSFVEEYIPAEDGYNLTLTIDSEVQYKVEQVLQKDMEILNGSRATVVLMNCKTGEIVAMANTPTFNLNNPNEIVGLTKKYEQTFDAKAEDYFARIWNSWAITMPYEPGSTFKPIFAAAALNEGLLTTDEIFNCSGSYVIYDAQVDCYYQTAHGAENLRKILINSCNCGMSMISQRMTTSKWLQYQEAFGMAQLTGIDLAGESGDSRDLIYIGSDEAEARGSSNDMGPFEKATTSFGQGFKLTPIQLVCAFSSVVNGGEYLKPYVVSQVTDSTGNVVLQNSKTVLRYTVSEDVSRTITSYLQGVVASGTGKNAQVPGYNIGGKTGSGEQVGVSGTYEDATIIYSTITVVPVDDPQYVMLVAADDTDGGVSYQISRLSGQIWEQILPSLGIYPDADIFYKSFSPSDYPVDSPVQGYNYGDEPVIRTGGQDESSQESSGQETENSSGSESSSETAGD